MKTFKINKVYAMLLFAGSLPCLAQFLPPTMAERYLPPTDHWKIYEADTGEQFKLDLSRIGPWLNGRAIAYVYAVGVDISPNIVIFYCNGYYQNGAGPIHIAPPRSVMGAIAKDVCRVSHNKDKADANPTANPAQHNVWKTFTSADRHFSVLFPKTPTQSSQPLHFGNRKTGTAYYISVDTDNGKTTYFVTYTDLPPDVAAKTAVAVRQGTENGFAPRTTILSNEVSDLDGVPGRAITAADAEYNYKAHDFMVGNRFYRLCVTTAKGDTATKANRFMDSFRILGKPSQP